ESPFVESLKEFDPKRRTRNVQTFAPPAKSQRKRPRDAEARQYDFVWIATLIVALASIAALILMARHELQAASRFTAFESLPIVTLQDLAETTLQGSDTATTNDNDVFQPEGFLPSKFIEGSTDEQE